MRRSTLAALRSLALSAALLLPLAAQAEKIGYFEAKRVIAEVEDAKAAKSRLEAEVKTKQKQLDVQKTELERLQKDLEAKKAVLSPSALQQAEGELIQKMQNAQRMYMELQQDLAMKEQQAMGELLQRLEPVVREIAAAEGYDYVFEKDGAGLFYAPSGHDLTAQVIRKYNQRFPKGSGAAKGSDKKGK